jgi:hypothetical protein
LLRLYQSNQDDVLPSWSMYAKLLQFTQAY